MNQQNQAFASAPGSDNPFFAEGTGPFGVAPFGAIRPEHFQRAFERAFAAHQAEVTAIATDPAPPTFANTIDALERCGDALTRAAYVFGVLSGAHTNDAIQEVERALAPLEAQHWNRILMDEALFSRIDALHQQQVGAGFK